MNYFLSSLFGPYVTTTQSSFVSRCYKLHSAVVIASCTLLQPFGVVLSRATFMQQYVGERHHGR